VGVESLGIASTYPPPPNLLPPGEGELLRQTIRQVSVGRDNRLFLPIMGVDAADGGAVLHGDHDGRMVLAVDAHAALDELGIIGPVVFGHIGAVAGRVGKLGVDVVIARRHRQLKAHFVPIFPGVKVLVGAIDLLGGQVFGADDHIIRNELAGVGQRPFDDAGLGRRGRDGAGRQQQANNPYQAKSAYYHVSVSQKVQQAGGFEFQDELPDALLSQADVIGLDLVAQVAPVGRERRNGRAAAAHEGIIQERLLHPKPKNHQAIYSSLVEFQNFLRFKLENELLNALVGKVDIFLINLVTDVIPVSL
jgi:hypothetical protein